MAGGGDRCLDGQFDGQRRRAGRIGRRDIDLDAGRIRPDITHNSQIADSDNDKFGIRHRFGNHPDRRQRAAALHVLRRYHVSPG